MFVRAEIADASVSKMFARHHSAGNVKYSMRKVAA
jgi:hypothetical protein